MNLKEKIRAKFGTISRFARAAGLQTIDVYNSIKSGNATQITALHMIADELEPIVHAGDWTQEHADKVVLAILEKYGTYTKFSQAYPEFPTDWLSCLIHGRFKRVSKKIKRLFGVLGIN